MRHLSLTGFIYLVCALVAFGWQMAPARPASASAETPAASHQTAEPDLIARFQPWELVVAVAWSPDGRALAASAGNKILWLSFPALEIQSAQDVGALTHSLAFSPDGRRLAAASRDGGVRVWDTAALASGDERAVPVLKLDAHRKGANVVAFSPDGTRLATAGNDGLLRLWDAATGERRAQIIGGTFAIPSLAFLDNGAQVAMVNGDLIRLRQVDGGQIAGTLRLEAGLYSMGVSPDGAWLALGDMNNTVRVWPVVEAFTRLGEFTPAALTLTGHTGVVGNPSALVWKVIFDPAGKRLVSAGGDGTLQLWAIPGGDPLATLRGNSAAMTSAAFSPDGIWLAAGSLDGALRVWNVSALK